MFRYGLTQDTGPFADPVNVAEVKEQTRVEITTDDTLLKTYIRGATKDLEEWLGLSLVVQTWKLTRDGFPEVIDLARSPLISVSSLQYIDTNGATQTVNSSDYIVDAERNPARVTPAYNKDWPSTQDRINTVTVKFLAGYATPFTANASTNVLTAQGRTFANNDKVRVSNSGGALPAGLSVQTDYYVVSASGSTLKLSATQGGAEIDISDTGTGTNFLGEIPEGLKIAIMMLAANRYENRETNPSSRIEKLLFPYDLGVYA